MSVGKPYYPLGGTWRLSGMTDFEHRAHSSFLRHLFDLIPNLVLEAVSLIQRQTVVATGVMFVVPFPSHLSCF